ncbi:MAG: ABC transporter substrate-binding protein [Bacteroidales bacterium]|nr:ABC transporter substrate-binding protein [Bacteroidales bacterium]MBS3775084.1 ABC transporter substrate-binding protein [Bacteroidales bacterium]
MKKATITILILLIFLASCGSRTGDENTESIDIATLRGPSAISMIHMIDSLQTIQDRKVNFQIKNEPLQIRPLLFQEKVEFAVVPTNMASILYNKGVNYQLAAVPVWGTLYLFGKSEEVTSWDDLKGKKIHLMAKGMTPDVMFRYLLDKNGIDPQKDVALDYSFPTHIELANAVASGKADLGVISEPMVSMVISKNNRIKPVISLNEAWKNQTGMEIPQTALLVHKEFAENNKQEVNQFLRKYAESTRWINNHPKNGSQLIVKNNILESEQVAYQSIPRCNIKFTYAYDVREMVTDYLKIFHQMNPDIIGGKLPDEDFYYKK